MTENNSSKARRDLPQLTQFTKELIDLVGGMIVPISHDESDHLGFMAFCFVGKQLEHLKSVRVLVKAGQHRDATLIARSMIEGMCLLKWAATQPSIRPQEWRSYAWVEDFRLLRSKESAGKKVDPSRKMTIEKTLKQIGDQFLTPKAKKKKLKNLPLPEDPYLKNWPEEAALNIFDELGVVETLYDLLYRETSGWIHWSVKGIAHCIERDRNTVSFSPHSENMGATALAAGFQSLYESASLLNSQCELGFTDSLHQLNDRYVKTLNGTSKTTAPNSA